MTRPTTTTLATLFAALLAAGTLAACDRSEPPQTVGQQVDGAVAKIEQKAEEIKTEAGAAAHEAKEAMAGAADAIANKAQDAAITASVNAELAKDPALSALRIDVDTVDGRVALRGTAPDTMARDRATQIAQAVEGVKSVDNLLEVSAKS